MRFDEEWVLIDKDGRRRLRGVSWMLCVLAVVASAIAPAQASEAPRMAPPPAWVIADAVPDKVPGASGLRYALVSDQVDLTGAAPQAYRRLSYTVQRAKSLDEAGQISIDYQPQYQQLALNSLEVWRDGRRIDMRTQAHYARLRRESGLEDGLIDGALTLSITLPDLRVGDRVDYGVTITGSNPVFGKGYYDVFDARYGVPLGERRVRVRYPAGMGLQWRVSAPGFSRNVSRAGDVATLDIAARDLPAVQEEKDAPEDVDPYGLIEVSTAGNWETVAAWAAQLYPRAFKDARVAEGMVQSLQLRSDDPQGALLRAVAFVQGEIRYVGLDMGENSHAPHTPEVTLRNRYGDCKDKATLLIALLQLAGIRAEPVLVSSDKGHGLDLRLPSPYAFDHVVVRAHLPQGEVWVDATRDREEGPLAQRLPLPFVRGLPVMAGQRDLVAVPSPMPTLPQIEVDEEIAVSLRKPQRVATFSVDTTYRQGRGERVATSFEDNGAQAVGEHYLEFMQQYYTALTQVGVPTIDATDRLNVRTHEAYRLEWPADEGDEVGFPLFQLGEWMDALPAAARKSPLALDGPRLARQTVRVRVDPAVQVEADTQVVANPWFRFSRTVSMHQGRIVIVGEWQRLSDRIPASGVKRAAADMERARDLLYFNHDLKPHPRRQPLEMHVFVYPLAGLLALVVLVLACLAWWRGGGLGGMLFDPHTVAQRLHAQPGARWSAWCVFGLVVVLSSWMWVSPRPLWVHAIAVVIMLAIALVGCVLLQRILRWMGGVAQVGALLPALLGSALPWLVCLLAALAALGGDSVLFGTGVHDPARLAQLAMAVLLMLLGGLWWSIAAVQAVAGATGGTRARAFGALALTLSVLGMLIAVLGVPVALVAMR
ncbi:transglutaminase-like putative cysteine protease [Xanthomonas arboricola]|nr:transglutaminase-like putative cysteine protease [Xanthomonas euroxanthea]